MSNYSWSSSYPPELKESMQGWKGYPIHRELVANCYKNLQGESSTLD